MLFLLAAGLTLVFGIMDMINLAHGSLYMLGAFIASTLVQATGSFVAGVLLAIPATAMLGMVLEIAVLRTLYARDHLSQVLATFALILIINELTRLAWGSDAALPMPQALSGPVELLPGLRYPAYRLVIIAVGVLVALLLFVLVTKTRVGMRVRAGASNREMALAMGVDIKTLFTLVFGVGAALCAVAGAMLAPLFGAGRHGREHPDPRLRGDRHRRHRLDPRRAGRRGAGGHRRHDRPGLPADRVRHLLPAARGERRRPGDRLGDDLPPDGGGALFPAARPVSGARMKRSSAVFIVLLGFPLAMSAIDNLFYVSFASRVIIYAIAATSLNLVLGYGGMISFGHAAFVGAGAYAVSICIAEGVASAWLGWPAAIAA